MGFRVELTSRAQRDIEAIYAWLAAEEAGEAGARWFTALRAAIASLSSLPTRCQVAPESRQSRVEIRQLLYGRRPHIYRILFAIERDVVQVLHIRHGRRRQSRLPDIGVE